MNSFNGTRHRRNLLDLNGFAPTHFPITSYSTDSRTKEEMKHTFGETLFFNNFHLIPDPLKKNLADSVITGEDKKPSMVDTEESVGPRRPVHYPSLAAGITSFFSGVLSVMGTIFQKRATTPSCQYYDCFDFTDQQMSQSTWQSSKIEVQNKSERDPFGSDNEVNTNLEVEMSADCRLAASHCEDKLNQVRLMLTNNNKKNGQSPLKFHPKRSRKSFVEAGSVEESFEDAISPEDFVSLDNNSHIEYHIPYSHHNEEFIEADAPKVKTELCGTEPKGIVHGLSIESNDKQNLNERTVLNDKCFVNTEDIVSSCEDKLSELKALLLSRCHKIVNTETEQKKNEVEIKNPTPIPVQKSLHEEIPSEAVFASKIDSSELADTLESFNEVTGKFFSSSLESDDSFQIVFSDSPRNCRRRISSDCDSEDSFIVFEETPDSCYTSHDVFGEDAVIDEDDTDSDSDMEEDSGVMCCKLAHNLSRTFGDLTDNSLYGHDVTDSVRDECKHICNDNVNEEVAVQETQRGSLMHEKRKYEKLNLPSKKVTFSSQPPKVHVLRVWAFAARQARAGHWERHALDRERFKRRIADVEMAISWVFKRQHRSRIVFQRFRPFWNAQRRKELAEKKERERNEEERNKQEDTIEQEAEGHLDGNVINATNDLINNTDIVKVNNVHNDTVVNCKESTKCINKLDVDLNECIEKQNGQQEETEQALDYKMTNTTDSNPNIESINLNDVDNKTDIEVSKSTNIFNDVDNALKENGVQSGFKFNNNCKSVILHNDLNKTPEINHAVNITFANKIHDLNITDTKVDT